MTYVAGLELVKVAVVPVTSDKPIYICGNISCESDDTVWPSKCLYIHTYVHILYYVYGKQQHSYTF